MERRAKPEASENGRLPAVQSTSTAPKDWRCSDNETRALRCSIYQWKPAPPYTVRRTPLRHCRHKRAKADKGPAGREFKTTVHYPPSLDATSFYGTVPHEGSSRAAVDWAAKEAAPTRGGAIWHHCNTTSGMVPCSSDAVPPRLWSTMTEMPKGSQGSGGSCGLERRGIWERGTGPLCRPPLEPSDGPWHASAGPLASSPKAVSIPSPSCVAGVSCLVSEFHTHAPWVLSLDVPYVRALVDRHPSATGAPCGDASRGCFGSFDCRQGIR
ncbi:hypothetical protein FZEAL_9927, partial [Fusarium zealandicum]